MIMKLWKKWKKEVDKHNEKQTYATCEEVWSYYIIFTPLIVALSFILYVYILSIFVGKSIVFTQIILYFIMSFILISLGLFLNWKAYD